MEKFFTEQWKRTHSCGKISEKNKNESIILNGWIRSLRDHGKLLFVDLWDSTGTSQVVFELSDLKIKRSDFQYDAIIAVRGTVRLRPEGMKNPKKPTGQVELLAKDVALLSPAKTPPFREGDNVNEDLSLKYRYLDLRRRKDLRRNLKVRHDLTLLVRNHLSRLGFQEIETPLLYKSTPEGARDYLVPSRIHEGCFYALPQSPQTLKQTLMISGWDSYFQIAKCFRDEDLRANRQPEFTQIDIEMNFIIEKDVRILAENLIKDIWKTLKNQEVSNIPILTYEEAEDRFGTDKPDLRNSLELKTVSDEFIKKSKLKIFESALSSSAQAKGLFVPKISFSRSQLDNLQKEAQSLGAKGLLWVQNQNETYKTSLGKGTSSGIIKNLYQEGGGTEEGCCFFVMDEKDIVNKVLSRLVHQIGEKQGFIDKTKDQFVWIVDFPLFEYDSRLKKWSCRHHPFTSPQENDLDSLNKANGDLLKIKAKAYDLVCNGHELAGGSIRNSSYELQKKIFSLLNLKEKDIKERFGFFLEALTYGTPPHGGIAFGLDRIVMSLVETENIKDVMAFPKSSSGSCLMSESPSSVDLEHLVELGFPTSKS